jgi:hypothetical protein
MGTEDPADEFPAEAEDDGSMPGRSSLGILEEFLDREEGILEMGILEMHCSFGRDLRDTCEWAQEAARSEGLAKGDRGKESNDPEYSLAWQELRSMVLLGRMGVVLDGEDKRYEASTLSHCQQKCRGLKNCGYYAFNGQLSHCVVLGELGGVRELQQQCAYLVEWSELEPSNGAGDGADGGERRQLVGAMKEEQANSGSGSGSGGSGSGSGSGSGIGEGGSFSGEGGSYTDGLTEGSPVDSFLAGYMIYMLKDAPFELYDACGGGDSGGGGCDVGPFNQREDPVEVCECMDGYVIDQTDTSQCKPIEIVSALTEIHAGTTQFTLYTMQVRQAVRQIPIHNSQFTICTMHLYTYTR